MSQKISNKFSKIITEFAIIFYNPNTKTNKMIDLGQLPRSVMISISKNTSAHRRTNSGLLINRSIKRKSNEEVKEISKSQIILNIPYRTNKKEAIL